MTTMAYKGCIWSTVGNCLITPERELEKIQCVYKMIASKSYRTKHHYKICRGKRRGIGGL